MIFSEEVDNCGLPIAEDIQWNAVQKNWIINGAEGIATYSINPMEFLKLTTISRSELDRILKAAKNKEHYLSKEVQDDMHVAPNLIIEHDEKITGHEGRHRAAAIINHGEKEMLIGIVADSSDEKFQELGWKWKRSIPVSEHLIGQFTGHRHKIDQSKINKIDRDENGNLIS
jgi:hypothetical protein